MPSGSLFSSRENRHRRIEDIAALKMFGRKVSDAANVRTLLSLVAGSLRYSLDSSSVITI